MTGFTEQQIEQLLKPINERRVLKDGKGHSHVSQQDITAHLIRMFGFGGFDTEVLSVECIFEDERVKDGKPTGRYDVCYRALLRLSIRATDGKVICQYEDGSTATAQNQTRGDGHDLAYKSAISLAKKRAAINLGDQFGLSLYNKGQMTALVMRTLVGAEVDSEDVQDGVERQVSMGNDEIDYTEPVEPVDPELANQFAAAIDLAITVAELEQTGAALAKSAVPAAQRETLRARYSARLAELRAAA